MAELVCRIGKGIMSPTFDGDGRVIFCGNYDNRIYCETDAGSCNVVELSTVPGMPACVAADHLNQLFIGDTALGAITMLKEDGSVQNVVDSYEGVNLLGPTSLCFDSVGQLFFTDAGPFGQTSLSEPKGSVFVVSDGVNRILRPLAYSCLANPTGCTLSPNEDALYVTEQAANRVLRFCQKPAGVWHYTVFYQFSGRLGPSSIVCDPQRNVLYVARPELPVFSENAVISVISLEGKFIREFEVPGSEISGLNISADGAYLFYTETTRNSLYRITLD